MSSRLIVVVVFGIIIGCMVVVDRLKNAPSCPYKDEAGPEQNNDNVTRQIATLPPQETMRATELVPTTRVSTDKV